MFKWVSNLFSSEKKEGGDQSERRHSFDDAHSPRTRSKGKKRSSPEPKRRRSDEPPIDYSQMEFGDKKGGSKSGPSFEMITPKTEKSDWVNVDVSSKEHQVEDQNNSAVGYEDKRHTKSKSNKDSPDSIVIADPPSPEHPEIIEAPSMMKSVWENVETTSTKEHVYKDCVVIETTKEHGDRLSKDGAILFPEISEDEGVRLSTGSFINIESMSECSIKERRKMVDKNYNAKRKDENERETTGNEKLLTSFVQINMNENAAQEELHVPTHLQTGVNKDIGGDEAVDQTSGDINVCLVQKDETKSECASNESSEKDEDVKYVVPKMPVSKGKGGNKLGMMGKNTDHKKKEKKHKTPEKRKSLEKEKEQNDNVPSPIEVVDKDINAEGSDEKADNKAKQDLVKSESESNNIGGTDKTLDKNVEPTKPKQKYVIPSRRNKDGDSPEKQTAKVEEHPTEPKNFLEVVQRKTAHHSVMDPKKLMFEMGYLKDVKQTDIEAAVIGQYKIAAEKKLFAWIKQARYNAELIFSQTWIEENLPTLGGKKDQDWKRKKQERKRGGYSEYESKVPSGMCRDVRLETDPTLQVVRENLGSNTSPINGDNQEKSESQVEVEERSNKTAGDAKNGQDKSRSSRLKYTDVRLETNPNLEVVRENAAEKPKSAEGKNENTELSKTNDQERSRSSRLKYTDVRLETNPNLEVVKENAAEKPKSTKGKNENTELSKTKNDEEKSRSSRLKYTDVRLETNPNLEVVRENAAEKPKSAKGKNENTELSKAKNGQEKSRSSRLKYTDVRLETNPNLEVVRENAAEKTKSTNSKSNEKIESSKKSKMKHTDRNSETSKNCDTEKTKNRHEEHQETKSRSSRLKYTDVRLETNPNLEVVRENAADRTKHAHGQHHSGSSRMKYTDVRLETNPNLEVVRSNAADSKTTEKSGSHTAATDVKSDSNISNEKSKQGDGNDRQGNVNNNADEKTKSENQTKSQISKLPSELEPQNQAVDENQVLPTKSKSENTAGEHLSKPAISSDVQNIDHQQGEEEYVDKKQETAAKVGSYLNYSEALKASPKQPEKSEKSEEPEKDETESKSRNNVSGTLNSLLNLVESEVLKTFDSNGNPLGESVTDDQDEQTSTGTNMVETCVKIKDIIPSKKSDDDIMACVISEVKIKEEGNGFVVNTKLEKCDEESKEIKTECSKNQYVSALDLVNTDITSQNNESKQGDGDKEVRESMDGILDSLHEVDGDRETSHTDKQLSVSNEKQISDLGKDNCQNIHELPISDNKELPASSKDKLPVSGGEDDKCMSESTVQTIEKTCEKKVMPDEINLLTQSVQSIVKDVTVLDTQQQLEAMTLTLVNEESGNTSVGLGTQTETCVLTESTRSVVTDVTVLEKQDKVKAVTSALVSEKSDKTEMSRDIPIEHPVLTQSVLSIVEDTVMLETQTNLEKLAIDSETEILQKSKAMSEYVCNKNETEGEQSGISMVPSKMTSLTDSIFSLVQEVQTLDSQINLETIAKEAGIKITGNIESTHTRAGKTEADEGQNNDLDMKPVIKVTEADVNEVEKCSLESDNKQVSETREDEIQSIQQGDIQSKEQGDIQSIQQGDIQSKEQGDIQSIEQGDIQSKEQGDIQSIKQGDIQSIEQGLRNLITEMAANEKHTGDTEDPDLPHVQSIENDGLSPFGSMNPTMVRSCEHLPKEGIPLSKAVSMDSLSTKSENGGHRGSKLHRNPNGSRIYQSKQYSSGRSYDSPSNKSYTRNKNWHYPSTPVSGSSRHDSCKQPTPGRYDYYSSPHRFGQNESYQSRHGANYSDRHDYGYRGRGVYTNVSRGTPQKYNYSTPDRTKHSYSHVRPRHTDTSKPNEYSSKQSHGDVSADKSGNRSDGKLVSDKQRKDTIQGTKMMEGKKGDKEVEKRKPDQASMGGGIVKPKSSKPDQSSGNALSQSSHSKPDQTSGNALSQSSHSKLPHSTKPAIVPVNGSEVSATRKPIEHTDSIGAVNPEKGEEKCSGEVKTSTSLPKPKQKKKRRSGKNKW